MNLLCIGINYRSASLELRERLSFGDSQAAACRTSLRALGEACACVLLATCNRTEIYLHSEGNGIDPEAALSKLCACGEIDVYRMKQYFYVYEGSGAVRHLFRVANGMDSMLVGENQILGQVRDAHAAALAAKDTDPVLNVLFRQALTLAKDVKTRTGISKAPLSLGTLAIETLTDMHGNRLGGMQALVIGCGAMGKLALRHLCGSGIGRRDGSRPYAGHYRKMPGCQIVISATTSPYHSVTLAELQAAGVSAAGMTFVDLAMPRDIDEEIAIKPGVLYIGIDQLRRRAETNSQSRLREGLKSNGGDLVPLMENLLKAVSGLTDTARNDKHG